MATDQPGATPKRCPTCGHENVPGARFCARCGDALDGATPLDDQDIDETQMTTTYVPIETSVPEAPWGESEAERTAALPVQDAIWSPPPAASAHVPQPRKESLRGLVLGIVATLIILAVLAYYVYAAWLSESLQNDIADWLP